ncbi:hypothetical protein QZH41_020366 [Actinostola sp. cb2023]|nr:hypothetical protein QZH41_020366 [Actinostola sp. cb2023]
MPRKKRGPKPKAEVEKAKENTEQGSQSDKESSNNETPVKPEAEPDKVPFPTKRPRGRPSKKWQEQLAIAIAEGRAVPIEPKKKKKDKAKGEKKEKAAKKDKKENKTPKTPKAPKKDKKEKEEPPEVKPESPQPVSVPEKESQPIVPEPEVVVTKPQKSPTLIYLENIQAFLDKLFEYQWPQDENGEYNLLEHQLCDFLSVPSLYSKHQQDAEFREVTDEEKEFLKNKNIITDAQQTKNLWAISTADTIHLLLDHYPNKYQDYLQIAHKREKYTLLKKMEDEKIAKEAKKIPNPLKRALKDAVEFNSQLALQRREERCSYFDMQTQIIHVPHNKMSKLPKQMTLPSKYPVSLLPGQFQEFYKSYSPALLRSFPLGTVLDSKVPQQATDSGSDSVIRDSIDESESSSSSSSSSSGDSDDDDSDSSDDEGSSDQLSDDEDERGSEPPAKRKSHGYKPPHRPDALCGICLKGSESNKKGYEEDLIHCSQCENSGHPSCLDMSPQLVKVIITYPWQCMECKTCTQCRDPFDEDKMLFCDECDRGYHSFCVGLKQIPVGRWTCELCGVCASCLRRTPGEGPNSRWKSEYTKPRDKSEPQFLQTLCSPCSRLFRSGNFCPVCLKVYRNDESDLPMVCCDECDRWVHTDCDDIDDKSYAELSKEKTKYRCVLCRGEREERMDSFARKNRNHEANQESQLDA